MSEERDASRMRQSESPSDHPGSALRHLHAMLGGEPWRPAILGAILFVFLAFCYWLVAPRTYRARAVVAPSSRPDLSRLPSALGGLAGQLGLAAGQEMTNSPNFYMLLGSSESLEREVLFSTLQPRPGERRGRPVWRALGIAPCDSLCILRHGLKRLASAVDIVPNRQTGTFEISAVLRDPSEAAAVVDLYITAMERFNRDVRRTQARASREFLEGRVVAATHDLRVAEDDLQRFYEANANWNRSPRLTLTEGRLRRDIESGTEVRANLLRQLEAARLDEVNSTPLLSIIDPATPPLVKYAPRGVALLMGALVAGGLLGIAVGVLRMRRTS